MTVHTKRKTADTYRLYNDAVDELTSSILANSDTSRHLSIVVYVYYTLGVFRLYHRPAN